jgi:hypothetical protein
VPSNESQDELWTILAKLPLEIVKELLKRLPAKYRRALLSSLVKEAIKKEKKNPGR